MVVEHIRRPSQAGALAAIALKTLNTTIFPGE